MISVILAGGKGVRLWPGSTPQHPKQLCDFMGRGSLLAMTLQRLSPLGPLTVVCGNEQSTLIETEQNTIGFKLLCEPIGKNTAPAVGLVLASGTYDEEELLGFFPADHYIEDDSEFQYIIQKAENVAKEGYLVSIGITLHTPKLVMDIL